MLSVKEIRALARAMSRVQFCQQMGPFALVQRPPAPVLAEQAMRMGASRTVHAHRAATDHSALSLLLEFEHLSVATLPPVRSQDVLGVGRLPDSDLVVDDPSVSKRHAALRWDANRDQALVRDLGSTNGTFVNDDPVGAREAPLFDGTVLSFGDVDYWFLQSTTLHEKLVSAGASSGRMIP